MTEGPCSRPSSNIITGCKYCSRDLLFIWEQSNERWAVSPASAGMRLARKQVPNPLPLEHGGDFVNVWLPLQTLHVAQSCRRPIFPNHASVASAPIHVGVSRGLGLGFVLRGAGV